MFKEGNNPFDHKSIKGNMYDQLCADVPEPFE
jgi:hypothetical protein